MVVLGGIGTLWGSALGAALVVQLEDYLSTSGFDGIGIVTGTVFVLVVLLFRQGLWGAARQLRDAVSRRRARASGDSGDSGANAPPSPEPVEPAPTPSTLPR
jgi:branched-chain amino acid transport system permease protein